MSFHYKLLFLATLASISAGCCFRAHLTDLTQTTDVQHSGFLGLELRTTREALLVKDQRTRLLFLATTNFQFLEPDDFYKGVSEVNNQYKQVGVLDTGAKLLVNQVMQVKEPIWVLPPLPGYYIWNCTLAKVEDGPYAGKEIAVAGEGLELQYDEGTVMLGSSSLRPVNQTSLIPALYNMHSYSCPPPAKYDFYDSRSNLFATVTLILPVSYFPLGKLDGMWFGSLAKSYVRPNSPHLLASDQLNVHELHRLTGYPDYKSKPLVGVINLNPDEPDDWITLFMPISETNGPVRGHWVHATDAGEVESGTFAGPIH